METEVAEVLMVDKYGNAQPLTLILNPIDSSSNIVKIEANNEYSLESGEFLAPTVVIDGGGRLW